MKAFELVRTSVLTLATLTAGQLANADHRIPDLDKVTVQVTYIEKDGVKYQNCGTTDNCPREYHNIREEIAVKPDDLVRLRLTIAGNSGPTHYWPNADFTNPSRGISIRQNTNHRVDISVGERFLNTVQTIEYKMTSLENKKLDQVLDPRAQEGVIKIRVTPDFSVTTVQNLYRLILVREGDSGGVKFHADLLKTGVSMQQIAAGLLKSNESRSEVQNRFTGMTPFEVSRNRLLAGFQALFSATTGGAVVIDSARLDQWSRMLTVCAGRTVWDRDGRFSPDAACDRLADLLVQSPEFQNANGGSVGPIYFDR